MLRRYAWKTLSVVIESTMNHTRRKLYEQSRKSNSIIMWMFAREAAVLKHYQDMSIELDMIHDWLDDEHRYIG